MPTGTAAKAINLTLALETTQKEEELGAQTLTNSSAAAAGKGADGTGKVEVRENYPDLSRAKFASPEPRLLHF